mmetsp:Transcript_54654/g.153776  ORF Transcript_54654/g.153776 Transcript_54654/m.153776 type:complete len:508 (+) Transcript_54654:221-1744(+)
MFGEGWRPPPTDAVLNNISQEFTYEDLAEATGNFSHASRLGEGTYGAVFRGSLRDGTEVAIKALAQPKEGGFREEVEVLSRFRHPNLVILMGFARKRRERYLVYELLPGGDLNSRMGRDAGFTWWHRLSVLQDAALGLSHLHGSRPQVFHRDVKSQNILMDKNGTGKVADFGLACLAQPNQKSLVVSQASGTVGYADPLYIQTGVVTEMSEVYSLGMVLLEVLTGRPPALQHPNGHIEYQFDRIHGDIKRLHPLVDRRAGWPPVMIERIGTLALQCICDKQSCRPAFVEIVTRLRNWLREEPPPAPARPLRYAAPGWVGATDGSHQHRAGGEAHLAEDPPGWAGWGVGPSAAAAYHEQAQLPPPPPRPQAYGVVGGTVVHQVLPSPRVLQAVTAAAARPPSDPPGAGGGTEQQRGFGSPDATAAAASVQQRHWQARPSPADAAHGRPNHDPADAPAASQSSSDRLHLDREGDIATLVEMGYGRGQAVEAFKRCSTIEAAVTWLLTQD